VRKKKKKKKNWHGQSLVRGMNRKGKVSRPTSEPFSDVRNKMGRAMVRLCAPPTANRRIHFG
jgi:hypothetical protein